MSYIPSEDALNQYDTSRTSLGKSYKDYLQGYGTQLLQSGAMGGYHLANLPSYAYEAITGNPLYTTPKPDVTEFIPKSEAGQIGKHAGETVADITSFMIPGRLGLRGLRALTRYHPLTQGQMGRQIQGPINAAQESGITHQLAPKDIYELDQLLSHPGLESGGSTGRALTPLGRQAIIEGAHEGSLPSLFSGQSLLGDLERAIPRQGEAILASSRIRPLKERILEGIQQSMREGGLTNEAEELQQGREAARRYYKTRERMRKIGKTVGKPLSIAALIKAGLSAAKKLP